jgi:hypothetical protein
MDGTTTTVGVSVGIGEIVGKVKGDWVFISGRTIPLGYADCPGLGV